MSQPSEIMLWFSFCRRLFFQMVQGNQARSLCNGLDLDFLHAVGDQYISVGFRRPK
jgi:hypothetical protein